jgi:hypothetical protein
MSNDGGPAFPVHGGHHSDDDPRNQILGGGMSLRDWFAGQALAGIIAADDHTGEPSDIGLVAYALADAMLAARNSTPTKEN